MAAVPPYCLFTVSSQVGGSASFTKQRFYYTADLISTPIPPGTAAADLATWRTAIEPLILACYASDSSIVQTKLEIHLATELQEASEPVTDSGGVAGDSLPPQDCGVITWQYVGVGPSGRITRGRSFFSGVPEAQADGGMVETTYTDNLDALALAISGPQSIGGNMQQFQIWRPSSVSWGIVNGHNISPVLKTQRHRRPGS